MTKALRLEALEMLRRWTNRTTGIAHMGFICTWNEPASSGSLNLKFGKPIEELRELAASHYPGAFRVMIMGRSEHAGQPVMRLEAWEKSTGASVALIQPFRRGLFGHYPRPSGSPIDAGSPPPPSR